MKVTIEEINNKIKNGYTKIYHRNKDGVKCISVSKGVIGAESNNVINITKDISIKTPIWLENPDNGKSVSIERIVIGANRKVVVIHNVCRTDAILLGWVLHKLESSLGKSNVKVIKTSPYEKSYDFINDIEKDTIVLYIGHYIYVKDKSYKGSDVRTENLLSPLSEKGIDYTVVDCRIRSYTEIRALNSFFGKVGIKYNSKELANIVYSFSTIGHREWPRKNEELYKVDIWEYFNMVTVAQYNAISKLLQLDKDVKPIVENIEATSPNEFSGVARGTKTNIYVTLAKVLNEAMAKSTDNGILELTIYSGHIDPKVYSAEVLKKLGCPLLIKYIALSPWKNGGSIDYALYFPKEYKDMSKLERYAKDILAKFIMEGKTISIHKAE